MHVPPIDRSACVQEPIHIPGGIQPHGVLFVVELDDLTIVSVSENIEAMLGQLVAEVLGAPLSVIFGAVQGPSLESAIRNGDFVGFNPMRVSIDVGGWHESFECTISASGKLCVIELERCESVSADEIDLFDVRKPIARLHQARDIAALARVATIEVASICGFDRVMVYRFDEDWNGEIIAETTSGSKAPDSFLGLHFPASDIPEQARRLYLENPVRLIANVNYVRAALVPVTDSVGSPIDLSGAILRSVSPVHLRYLQNMGVRASMSISIVIAGRLWGLIACHHYRPRRIGYNHRSACVLLGDMLSWQIASVLATADAKHVARLRERVDGLGTVLRSHNDIGSGLVAAATDMLDLFEADGFAAVTAGNVLRVGRTPLDDEVIALIARVLRSRTVDGMAAHHALDQLDSAIEAFRDVACGALVIWLAEDMSDYVVCFRGEDAVGKNWGGDVRTPVTNIAGELTPRASFKLWVEAVRGQSRRWSANDMTTARAVRQLLFERTITLEREAANSRHEYLATHDTLTRLPNRAALNDLLGHTIAAAQRDGYIFLILFVDLDRFKLYNDLLGHSTGDDILQTAAARLQHAVRGGDFVARFGGDEFIVIARAVVTEDDGELIAKKIITALAEPMVIRDTPPILMTASIGIAAFPRDGTTSETLLHNADLAMYRTKQRGRDGFSSFPQTLLVDARTP